MTDLSDISSTLTASIGTLSLEKIISALITLAVCLIAIRVVNNLLGRILTKVSWDTRIKRYFLSTVHVILYVLTILIVADSIGIPVTSLIALVSVFGLAVSLAVQDVLSNVAGGLVILFSKPFELGDYIAANNSEGTVEEISLTHTKLDTFDGQRVMLPNSKVVADKITNYSTLGVRRVNHAVNVSYDCATDAVRASCLRAVRMTAGVLENPAPSVVIGSYGQNALEFRVRFWANNEDYWDAYNLSLENIRTCFAEDGIQLTYSHVNVHLVDR